MWCKHLEIEVKLKCAKLSQSKPLKYAIILIPISHIYGNKTFKSIDECGNRIWKVSHSLTLSVRYKQN